MTAFDLPPVASPSAQKPDARTVNDGGTDVMRQVIVIGDPNDPAAVLPIKAEDSPGASGDYGLVLLGQRRDSDTTAVDNDGDYATLKTDEAGRLKVSALPASIVPTTDNITSNGDQVAIDVSRYSNLMAYCFGTFSTINCAFEGSLNSTNGVDGNWFSIQAIRSNANTIETTTGNLSAAPAYGWELSVNGLKWFRVRATAFTSGTQTWVLQPAPYATEPIPGAQVSASQPVSATLAAASVVAGAFQRAVSATTNGIITFHHLISAASTNATSVKASAGTIANIELTNNSASMKFFKLYNKASAPTVGTDTPILTLGIPANGVRSFVPPVEWRLATGIAYAITGAPAVADVTAVALNDVAVSIGYL